MTNLRDEYLSAMSRALGDKSPNITSEDVFHFIYGVLQSPAYRNRYGDFLKMDFPRLPITRHAELFRELARLGAEIVRLHLLESPLLETRLTTFTGPATSRVERISFARNTVCIDKNQSIGFKDVPEEVWNFNFGGYKVCEKWLKDRKGRTLSKEDISHYGKIVTALGETIRLMAEIDRVIDAHGGWPGAFAVDKS
jgi:predicted helicase